MRLLNFFKYPSAWTKGAAARDKSGKVYNLNEYSAADFKNGNRLESFSLYGAIAHFYSFEKEPEAREKTIYKLRKAIGIKTGRSCSIAEFNDAPETKFKDIQDVLKIADKI